MGSAQGMITISNAVGNTIIVVSLSTPGVGAFVGQYVAGYVVQQLAPNYGSFWVFGVILVCGGLV